MSEEATSSDNSRSEVVYYYRHTRIKTSDDCIKTEVTKFINSDFFGSSFASKNQELQQLEKKIRSMKEALFVKNLQFIREKARFLQQARAGEVEHEEFRKRDALDIVRKYMIKKEEDEVHKLKEDYEKLKETMISEWAPTPPAPCIVPQ